MKHILAERGIQLTKSLGQNFLHDANQLRRIAAAADLNKSDKVLEVGPGLGPLTELLLERAGEVLAIEKDARLVEALRERLADHLISSPTSNGSKVEGPGSVLDPSTPNTPHSGMALRLLHDDALEYLKRGQHDWSGWKLVSNLPYSVASSILVELAHVERSPERMVATLQIEVAQRLMAKPGDANYGVLTLLVQLGCEPRGWFKIPASCFFPEPDVDSACVCLARREPPLLQPGQRGIFAKIVKRSFSQRRKMMFKLLKEDWKPAALEAAFRKAHLPASTRAESVALNQFVELTVSLDEE
jgi:16S rRNA (adenine1518-N6/adenine1519-N6)-dimethyltransferase